LINTKTLLVIEEMVKDNKHLLLGIKKVLDMILGERNSTPLFLFIKDIVHHLEQSNLWMGPC